MENKLKVFGVTVLILIFGLFLPSFLQFRDMDSYAGRTTSSIRTETKYTMTGSRKFFMIVICVRKIGKKRFSAQKFEQRKSVQRLSIDFLCDSYILFGHMSEESLFVVYSILFIPL